MVFPTLRRRWRGLTRRVRQRRLAAGLEREIRRCSSIGGALSLVLLALPGLEMVAEADVLLDHTAAWIATVHPGALAAPAIGAGRIAVLLPGASLARAQQFCAQLRRPSSCPDAVGQYLCGCAQGVAVWEPALTFADLWLRAESALHAALAGRAPVVLYHDSLPRLLGIGAAPSWEDWSV